MQKSALYCIVFAFTYFFMACQHKIHGSQLEGVWKQDSYADSTRFFKRANDINKTEGGFQFLTGGKLKVRQNMGWCATPPVDYETVSGTWEKISKDTMRLNYPYWGGRIEKDVVVLTTSASELQLKEIDVRLLQ